MRKRRFGESSANQAAWEGKLLLLRGLLPLRGMNGLTPRKSLSENATDGLSRGEKLPNLFQNLHNTRSEIVITCHDLQIA